MIAKQRMKAVYDCTADEPGEISFKEGDILVDVEESNEEGWYTGRIENTNIKGLFPFNYVTTIDNDDKKTPISAPKPDALSAYPSLDAFETVMAGGKTTVNKPSTVSSSWTPLVPSSSNKPPIVASKPASFNQKENAITKSENIGLGIKPNNTSTFELPKLKPITNNKDLSPSRSRSFSASAVQSSTFINPEQVLKPSQLKGTKSALEIALGKGSPKPPSNLRSNSFSKQTTNTNGIALVGLSNTIKLDLDEEDGFQILKPSQLKQRQQQQQQPKPSPTVSTNKTNPTVSNETSNSVKLDDVASKNPMPRLPSRPISTASRKSRNSRSVDKTVATESPSLKPKPVVTCSHPELPPRPKIPSNPPPLQPKPAAMSSIEILLSQNEVPKKSKPQVNPKPVIKPNSAPGLPTRPHLSNKRSLENQRETKPSVRARSATIDWVNKTETKKAAPPPPPSRAPKKNRYEVLFESISDDGYVDGETVQCIWIKSKLSNEDLARIWKDCDPDHKGLLDKTAFVDGMTKIDDILTVKQQQQRAV